MAPAPTPADGTVLTGLALAAVAARLARRPLPQRAPRSALLTAPGASFVTLKAAGVLRGCIGTLEPALPLHLDVVRNARQAMTDPRLPPVTVADWPHLQVCVSVLSGTQPLPCATRGELAAALRPGRDGLILASGAQRATFLPTVWEKLSDPTQFIAALLAKGGWPPGGWPRGLTALRYTTVEFHRTAPAPPPSQSGSGDQSG